MRVTSVLYGIVLVLALAGAPGVASAAEPAPTPAPATPAPSHPLLPASLVGLEQKMEELKVSTMRFSSETSLALSHSNHRLAKLLKLLLSTGVSGEETLSPASGNFTLTLFGHPFKLRVVGGATYLYLSGRGRGPHHRYRHVWVKLGPGGLLEVFTVNGKHLKPRKTSQLKASQPALIEPPFTGLRKALAGAEEVRETGTSTLDGQPVTSFLAILEPEQLEHENDLASASRRLPSPQPPMVTLETSLAANGLPVRTVLTEHTAGLTVTATVSIPAIDFPLAIEAPPASQTMTVAQLRKLERRARRRHSKRKR